MAQFIDYPKAFGLDTLYESGSTTNSSIKTMRLKKTNFKKLKSKQNIITGECNLKGIKFSRLCQF